MASDGYSCRQKIYGKVCKMSYEINYIKEINKQLNSLDFNSVNILAISLLEPFIFVGFSIEDILIFSMDINLLLPTQVIIF